MANFSKLLLPQLSSRPLKKVLEKFRFYGKITHGKVKKATESGKSSYTQILSKNIGNILENFLELLNKKIEELNKIIFSKTDKPMSIINMITKSLSCKQIIISMSFDNANKFISSLSKYIANFNQSLKNTKSDLIVDFICIDYQCFIVTSNRVTSLLKITIINNYIRNYNNINSKDIQDTRLS